MRVDQPEDADASASVELIASRRAQEAGVAAVTRGTRELVSARAALTDAKARVLLMEKAKRTEQLARERQAAKATAEISNLRQELAAAVRVATQAPATHHAGGRSRLMVYLAAIIALAAIAGLCVRYVDALHTWPKVAPRPTEVSAEAVLPERQAPAGSSAETHALSRLGDAVGKVAPQAMPSALKAANQWLGGTGEEACSVETAGGGASLVISGRGGDRPLLAALSRCAQAVEHLTEADK